MSIAWVVPDVHGGFENCRKIVSADARLTFSGCLFEVKGIPGRRFGAWCVLQSSAALLPLMAGVNGAGSWEAKQKEDHHDYERRQGQTDD